MNTTTANQTVEERIALVERLDLDPIKVKLISKEDGHGWPLERADSVERAYKRFLILNLKYKGRSVVPSKDIDAFWHQHILDTRKYAQDCAEIFGYFLHHFPYFGMRGADDAQLLKATFSDTCSLYEAEFHEPMFSGASHCEEGPDTCDSEPCAPEPSCDSAALETVSRERPRLNRELVA